MTVYAAPGAAGAKIAYKPQYNNFIGGKFVPPVKGQYFDVISPVNGKVYTQAARSTAEDIELALDAAHAAADAWGKTDAATRSNILLKIADRIEQNLELLAYAETVDNGKAIRETLNADIPLTVDHFRYFAGCVRAQEGALSNIDENTVAYHIQEPLGVVGQIIPWNFPILMAAWVSRRGLPLSMVSAIASSSRFCSMRSAILSKMLARSVTLVLPQRGWAAWAASSAALMSLASDWGTRQKALPVMGERLSK